MDFGVLVPTFSWPTLDYGTAAKIKDFATKAEALGFDSIWTSEHLLTAPGLYGTAWLSPMLCLAHMAAVTQRITLGTDILILPTRNPVVTAKEIATLDSLSAGRYILGVGVGWDEHEFEVSGVKFSERGGRTDEALSVIRRLLIESRVTHHGRYYHFDDVSIDPRCGRLPPIWIAGGSKIKTALSPDPPEIARGVLARIARADGWTSRSAGTQDMVKADWRKIVGFCRTNGRDPGTLTFCHTNFLHLVSTTDREKALREQRPYFERVMGTHRSWEHMQQCYFTGTTTEIIARLKDLEHADLRHMVLAPLDYDLEQIERYASEILPHFRT